MNIPPRRQQPYKGAAQRAAVGRPDMSAAMLLNVSFYFLCFLQYSGKLGMFRLIEAVVADAENAIAVRQRGMTRPKLPFQWQQVPGSSRMTGACSAPKE